MAVFSGPGAAQAATWQVPKGIVAQLDQFQELRNAPDAQNDDVISYIKDNVNRLPPFFTMELARRMHAVDEEEALWWYHVGYIRGVYDALRCADKTAANGLSVLNRIAPDVADMAARDQATFRRKGLEVLEWRELYRSEASPWWICSHGERAMQNVADGRPAQDRDWLRPRRLWPTIRAKLTADFTTVFIELEPLESSPPPARLD